MVDDGLFTTAKKSEKLEMLAIMHSALNFSVEWKR